MDDYEIDSGDIETSDDLDLAEGWIQSAEDIWRTGSVAKGNQSALLAISIANARMKLWNLKESRDCLRSEKITTND